MLFVLGMYRWDVPVGVGSFINNTMCFRNTILTGSLQLAIPLFSLVVPLCYAVSLTSLVVELFGPVQLKVVSNIEFF